MTPEQVTAIVKCLADLYQQLEEEQAEHASTRAEVNRLKDDAVKREQRIAELHDHVAALERPARVPSRGNPPL